MHVRFFRLYVVFRALHPANCLTFCCSCFLVNDAVFRIWITRLDLQLFLSTWVARPSLSKIQIPFCNLFLACQIMIAYICPICFLEIASSVCSFFERLIDVCEYHYFADRIVWFEPSFRGQHGWTEPQNAFCCNGVESSQEHSFATVCPAIRNHGPSSLFLLLSHFFFFAPPVRNGLLLYCDLDFEIRLYFAK